ncbi:MAG: hypothetical protein WC485_03470, partial [Opitutaceae bacterium]
VQLPVDGLLKKFGRTPVNFPGPPWLFGNGSASWQSRHSLFGTPGPARTATAAARHAPTSNNRPAHRAICFRDGGADAVTLDDMGKFLMSRHPSEAWNN